MRLPRERVESEKGRGPRTALSSTHILGVVRSKGMYKGAGGGLDREKMVFLEPRSMF